MFYTGKKKGKSNQIKRTTIDFKDYRTSNNNFIYLFIIFSFTAISSSTFQMSDFRL